MVLETLALTAGLIVLVVILAVAVFALEKLKPKRKPLQTKLQIYYDKPLMKEMQKPERLAELKMTERVLQLQSAFAAVKARVEMAHSRLDSIESELVRTKKAVLEQARLFATSQLLESERKEISELKELIESKTVKPESQTSLFERKLEEQRKSDGEYIKSIAFGRPRR